MSGPQHRGDPARRAFLADMERVGRSDDVAVVLFSKFGRRVAENANFGIDHGTAGPVFVAGKPVLGGQYGAMPSQTELDDGNMPFGTDFRNVYATMIRDWMGHPGGAAIPRQDFPTLPLFSA